MRPSILFSLFAETRTLPGVGPKIEKLIARVAGARLVDLVFDLPRGLIDRTYRPKLGDAEEGRIATALVTVLDHVPSRVKSRPYRVRCSDDTALIELVYFHGHADYLARTLPKGAQRIISGRIERFQGRLQMPHPDYVVEPEKVDTFPLHEPVYALTDGLPARSLLKAIHAAVDKVPEMPEWIDPALRRRHAWAPFPEALRAAHAP